MIGRSDKGSLEMHRGDTQERERRGVQKKQRALALGRQSVSVGKPLGSERVGDGSTGPGTSELDWMDSLRENGFADLICRRVKRRGHLRKLRCDAMKND